jgi:hypothetical protein
MHFKMHFEKILFQSNEYGCMDVDQDKFRDPIISGSWETRRHW